MTDHAGPPQGRSEIFYLLEALKRRQEAKERQEEYEALRGRLDVLNRAYHAVYGESRNG